MQEEDFYFADIQVVILDIQRGHSTHQARHAAYPET